MILFTVKTVTRMKEVDQEEGMGAWGGEGWDE